MRYQNMVWKSYFYLVLILTPALPSESPINKTYSWSTLNLLIRNGNSLRDDSGLRLHLIRFGQLERDVGDAPHLRRWRRGQIHQIIDWDSLNSGSKKWFEITWKLYKLYYIWNISLNHVKVEARNVKISSGSSWNSMFSQL